jgi:hypothetical protein
MKKILPWYMTFLILPCLSYAQLNWQYRYDGPYHCQDNAASIVYDTAGVVYVAGTAMGQTANDIVVLSLSSGDTNWVYDLPGNNNGSLDACKGRDGNIYVAGYIAGDIFTVISLTPSGNENWVYVDSNSTKAHALYATDSAIYAAGGFGNDLFTVASLRLDGDTNWVRHPIPGYAWSITGDGDHSIYTAGFDESCAAVVSMTTTGDINWVRGFPWSGSWFTCVKCGPDGNIYAAGYYYEYMEVTNWIVMSLTPAGDTNWTFEFDSGVGPYDFDEAYAIAFDADSNIYVAGRSWGNGIIVISLDRSGNVRGEMMYPGDVMGIGSSNTGKIMVYGLDDHIYVAGCNSNEQFIILKLDTLENIDWAYVHRDSVFNKGWV